MAPDAGHDPRDRKTVTIIDLAYSEPHLNRDQAKDGGMSGGCPGES
jgi:hypothetical protein